MALYSYQPLDQTTGSIRLVRILPGTFGEPIVCEMVETTTDTNGIPYEALSYVWGDTPDDMLITLDGKQFLIRQNLHEALQYLRSPEQPIMLWTDGICINQNDKVEKAQQVSQMGTIFEQAKDGVAIWLGPGSPEIDALMEWMQNFDRQVAASVDHPADSDLAWHGECRNPVAWFGADFLNDLDDDSLTRLRPESKLSLQQLQPTAPLLFDRPWFGRVWVIQEVARAKGARVVFGQNSVTTRTFAMMPTLLKFEVPHNVQALLDVMPGFPAKKGWWREQRDLRTLLRKFSGQAASVPRDRVYALLGISSDASNTNDLPIDYEISDQLVVQHTVKFLLRHWVKDTDEESLLKRFSYIWNVPSLFDNLPRLDNILLGWALAQQHNDIVETLLLHGDLAVERPAPSLSTPIHVIASERGGPERQLPALQSVDVKTFHEFVTPLTLAAERGRTKTVEILLRSPNIDILRPDQKQPGPLVAAARGGWLEIVALLLQQPCFHTSSLNEALARVAKREMVHALSVLEMQAEPVLERRRSKLIGNTLGRMPISSLWVAAYAGDAIAINAMLNHAVEWPENHLSTHSSLWIAASRGHKEVVKLLLSRGARPDELGLMPVSPLLISSRNGHLGVVELLLDYGADINARARTVDGWLVLLQGKKRQLDLTSTQGRATKLRDNNPAHWDVGGDLGGLINTLKERTITTDSLADGTALPPTEGDRMDRILAQIEALFETLHRSRAKGP